MEKSLMCCNHINSSMQDTSCTVIGLYFCLHEHLQIQYKRKKLTILFATERLEINKSIRDFLNVTSTFPIPLLHIQRGKTKEEKQVIKI